MGAGRIGTFANDDDSADQLRSKLLLAGLAGLGRLDAGDASSAADSLGVDLGRQTRWTRAIDEAAKRREPGMVAVIAAAGTQGGRSTEARRLGAECGSTCVYQWAAYH